jgi:hypothetical protein
MKDPNYIREIEVGGQNYLGICVASGKGVQTFVRMFSLSERTGFIAGETGIDPWTIQGFSEVEGSLYLYGPLLEEIPESFLSLLELPAASILPPRFVLFTRRLAAYFKEGLTYEKLYPQGIFFFSDGRTLFLPEPILQKSLALKPVEERLRFYEPYNHPDLTGEENASFFLGCIAYRLLTGHLPYQAESEETLHTHMRELPPLPVSLARPGIREEVSSFIQQSLIGKEKPSLSLWVEKMEAWSKIPLVETLSDTEIDLRRKQAEQFQKETSRAYTRKQFWQKHRTRVIGISILALILGYFGYEALSNALKPPRTLGFTPEQVVHLFYSSMNTLDHLAMEDCVTGEAGKQYINEVIQLFVISRMRMSVEFKNSMIDAETWYKTGRPPIPEGQTLYGIAELEIEKESETEEMVHMRVQFEKWVPIPQRGEEGEPQNSSFADRFKGFRIEEQVTLEKKKSRWVITEIQRLSDSPLTYF